MSKCLIISMFSKQESSYAEYYKDILKQHDVPFDILYFERYLDDYKPAGNELVFSRYCPTGGSKFKKIGMMLEYAHFVRSAIRKGKYTSIIVLTTVPAILICDILLKDYKGRYIIDIRDYTHEQNKLYYSIVEKLVDGADSVVLSSEAFKQFLPASDKYVVTHNITKEYTSHTASTIGSREPMVIGFVGSVRYFHENNELIRQVADSKRYSLAYYGTTAQGCDLEGFCRENGISNAKFYGKYNNAEKGRIYESIDIINAIYGLNGLETTTAIPNRFYDSAIYRCPIIVSKGTYLQTVVEKYGIGIAVDIHEENVVAALDSYLSHFDEDAFNRGCTALLQRVQCEMTIYWNTVDRFVCAMKND